MSESRLARIVTFAIILYSASFTLCAAQLQIDSMDNITTNNWQALGVDPGVRTIVEQNTDPAFVKEGTGSLKWTIVSDGANTNTEEHDLYSPVIGNDGDWSSYGWISFWMYVTSPDGGAQFGFYSQYLDDSAGWLLPLGGDGSPGVSSATYPMNKWVQVRLSIDHIVALDRDKMSQAMWPCYENGDPRFSVEDGHTYVIYIDDLELLPPDPPDLVDNMDDIYGSGWKVENPATNTQVEQNTDPAFVKEGTGSLKWTIITDNLPDTVEHSIGASNVGRNRDWSQYDTLSFWMYVTSPTGASLYKWYDMWLDNDPLGNPQGWVHPNSIARNVWIEAGFYPMDQWHHVVVDMDNYESTERDNMTQGRFISYENNPGYDLEEGQTYIIYIDDIRLGSSKTITNLADIKLLPDNQDLIAISDFVVTRSLGGRFYIENSDRSSGIMVDRGKSYQKGWMVSARGVPKTDDLGERYISAIDVRVWALNQSIPDPLGLPGRSIGGGPILPYTPGIPGSFGLNNIGLLVKSWGTATWVGDHILQVDDGSGILGAGLPTGIYVQLYGSETYPTINEGDFVTVTGISKPLLVSGNIYPGVVVMHAADVVIVP